MSGIDEPSLYAAYGITDIYERARTLASKSRRSAAEAAELEACQRVLGHAVLDGATMAVTKPRSDPAVTGRQPLARAADEASQSRESTGPLELDDEDPQLRDDIFFRNPDGTIASVEDGEEGVVLSLKPQDREFVDWMAATKIKEADLADGDMDYSL